MKDLINKYKNLSLPLKASFFFILCSFIQKGISLFTSPIFTRLLSTEEYGKYTLYNSWVEILSIFITLKITEAIFNKTMVNAEAQKRSVLSTFQVLLTILSILFLIFYCIFNKELCNITGLSKILMMSLIINVFFDSTIKLWMAYQRFEYKYITLIIVSITISILNPSIGLLAVYNFENKVFARILGIIIPLMSVGIAIYIYNIKNFKISNFKKLWKSILLFNIPLIPHYLSQILLNHADRIMIDKITCDDSQVAFYGLAYTIGMLATMITQSINSAYTPSIYKSLKNKKFDNIINTNLLLLFVVSSIILCIFMVAPELMLILGGSKYMSATYSIYPIATSVLFIFMYTLFANIELYYGYRKYVTIGTCISALLNIVLNYIFISKYGYIAAAYTTLFCYLCYGFFHIFVSKLILEKKENVKINLKTNYILVMSIIIIILSFIFQLFTDYIIIRYTLMFLTISILIFNYKKIFTMIKKYI